MNRFLIAAMLLLFSLPVNADVFLKDLPDGHWASDAVYSLIKAGVTSGYPDGTYRGGQPMSRYEIASLLSRFPRAIQKKYGIDEKLIAELKTELALIKYKRALDGEVSVSGVIDARVRLRPGASLESCADYRLRMNVTKKIGPDASLKIGLDTLDAGYNNPAARDLATELIDVEGKFKLGGVDYKITAGPGTIAHTETNDFSPSENNAIFIRPKSAVEASAKIDDLSLSAAYVTRQVATSGKVGVHELTGRMGYDFGTIAMYLRPRYLFVINGLSDKLIDLGVDWRPAAGLESSVMLSTSSFSQGSSVWYAKLAGKMYNDQTKVVLRLDKIGSKYRDDTVDEYEFIPLNNFDRLILDGTVDLGLSITQKLNDKASLGWKGDYVAAGDFHYGEGYPGTYSIWQMDLIYTIASHLTLDTFYRVYEVPSGIAQFSDAVPTSSNLFGLMLSRGF